MNKSRYARELYTGLNDSRPNEWNINRPISLTEAQRLIILAASAGLTTDDINDFDPLDNLRCCVRTDSNNNLCLLFYCDLLTSPEITFEEAIVYLVNKVKERKI